MMKDHEKRELVDALTKVAKEFAGAQQLRERIAGLVLPALANVEDSLRERLTMAELMAGCTELLRDDLIAAGVITKDVPPMFLTEAILRFIAGLKGRAEL